MNTYEGAFTIKDLKEAIKDLPDDLIVVLQSDPEGNRYRMAAGLDADNTGVSGDRWYNLETKYIKLTPELADEGYCEDDIDEDVTPCAIIWPV